MHDHDEWSDDVYERRSHNDHDKENDVDHREALMLDGDHKERQVIMIKSQWYVKCLL